ncbi:hypothetical protein B0H14DRAFT_3082045 [Mycena olivaceomarginata]|nr:hypothetical protein B0H14DRAFT_3082045 [Mycena olivaceomarginata]
MANITELPNAFTPLAFLPPALANQFEVSRYLYAATLGGYIWDIALNLGNDYALLFKHSIRFPTVVYFLSRAFTLAYILTSFVFQVANVPNCQALQAATAMLFFLRVTAIWHPNKIVFGIFLALWLAVIGSDITVPVGIRGAHIGPTMQCINTVVPENTEAVAIAGLINDTAIFFAINYRILGHTIVADSFKARLEAFIDGGKLSRLSRALVQGGQHFYLVAICANITLLVVLKIPSVPPVYHGMLTIPALAVINGMACLVFRRIKFGLITADGATTVGSDFHATATPHRSLPLHHHRRHDPTDTEFGSNTTFPLDVRIQKETHKYEDSTDDGISKPSKTSTLT